MNSENKKLWMNAIRNFLISVGVICLVALLINFLGD